MPCSPSHNVLLPHGRQHAAQRSQLAKPHPAQPQRVSGLKLQAVPCRLSRQQQCNIRLPGSCRTASTKHQGSPMQPTRVRVETADRALHDVGCAAPAHHAQLQWREGGRAEQVSSSGHAVSKGDGRRAVQLCAHWVYPTVVPPLQLVGRTRHRQRRTAAAAAQAP